MTTDYEQLTLPFPPQQLTLPFPAETWADQPHRVVLFKTSAVFDADEVVWESTHDTYAKAGLAREGLVQMLAMLHEDNWGSEAWGRLALIQWESAPRPTGWYGLRPAEGGSEVFILNVLPLEQS